MNAPSQFKQPMTTFGLDSLLMDVELLWESVEHWHENWTDPKNAKIYSDSCPLCHVYMKDNIYAGRGTEEHDNACLGCPISVDTGEGFCEGTPWVNIPQRARAFDRDQGDILPMYEYLVDLAMEYTDLYQGIVGLYKTAEN